MSSSHQQRLPGNNPGGGGSGKSSRNTSSASGPSGRAPSNASPAPAGTVMHTAVSSSSPPPPPLRSDVGAMPAMTSSSTARYADVTSTSSMLFGPYSTAVAPPPYQAQHQHQHRHLQPGEVQVPPMGGRAPLQPGQALVSTTSSASASLPPSSVQTSSAQRRCGPLAQTYASPQPPPLSLLSHSSAAVPLVNPSGALHAGSNYGSWRGNVKVVGGGGSNAGPRSGERHQRSGSGRSGGVNRGGGGNRHRHSHQQQQQQQKRRAHGGAQQDAHLSSVAAGGAPPDAPSTSCPAAESVAGLVTSPPSTRAESRAEAAPSIPWPPLLPPPPPPAPPSTSTAAGSAAASTPSAAMRSAPATAPPSRRAAPNTLTTTTTTAKTNSGPTTTTTITSGVVPTRSGGGTPAQQPQQQPPQQQQQRSPASASSAAVGILGDNAVAPLIARPGGEERPTVALSQNIMSVYEAINNLFYQERQQLLAAPAKNTVRKYEDPSGHYIPYPEEEIAERYVVKEVIGKGSFGTVLHCVDLKYQESVAVKVIRSGPYFEKQGWFEAQVVAHLNKDTALQNLVVQLRKVFLWKGHMVLVFEPLSFSLYRLITLTKYNGVSLDLTRKFAYQMMKVLLVLEQHDPPIIHCDLKPENVLLRDPSRSEVRVIDFGSACYQQQAEWTPPPAQVALPASSPSRSPGLPWDAARRTAEGITSATATTVVSAIHDVSAAPASAAALAAGDTAGGGGGSSSAAALAAHASTSAPVAAAAAAGLALSSSAGPSATQHHLSSTTTAGASGGGGGDDGDGGAVADVGAAVDGGGGGEDIIMPKYIQSRFYRSPEVILELGYTTAIDRWSLGCFLVEMHTGVPLFPGKNECDMMAYFTSIIGPLPDYMIAASPKRQQLYHTCTESPPTLTPTAASPLPQQQQQQLQQSRRGPGTGDPEFASVTPMTEAPGHAMGSPFFLRNPRCEGAEGAAVHPSLEDILGVRSGGPRGCRAGQPGHDEAAYAVFCDFIVKLLQYDPRKRVSCQQAIQHPFLEPIRALKSRPVAAPEAAAAVSASSPSAAAPSASTSAPPQHPQS